MSVDIVIAGESDLDAALAPLARVQRMVFFAGLPGVGKSLFIRQLALAGNAAGRTVHLLLWDVARSAFESPAILARYPERDGVTHAVIRKAVGQWARAAVLRWHHEHTGHAHILIAEAPLIGNRLLELAQKQSDDAEPLLAGHDAVFVTPVPSVAVRAVIERTRGRTFASPAHAREAADAPPNVLQMLYQEVHALAIELGAATPVLGGPAPFDPQAYAAVYAHLLRHRHAVTLWVDVQLQRPGSVYDRNVPAPEVVPAAEEAAAILARLEQEHTPTQIEHDVTNWFKTV